MIDTVPPVRIDGPRAVVDFDRFDLDAYQFFLRAKALPESQVDYDGEHDVYHVSTPRRFADRLGAPQLVERPELLPLADHLFDYQTWCVRTAVAAKRWACWLETGLGKSAIILEWARQVRHLTGGRVLILDPLAVIPQMQEEAQRFYGEGVALERLATREALAAWCAADGPAIGITNPEKFIPGVLPELRNLTGLAFDESSRLKAGGGVVKWNVIKSARGIEYKLSSTATPAPNEAMEYASQASFLEKLRTEADILWTYFSKDARGAWQVKPHARAALYEFMASWSLYLRNPATFGWRDVLADLPDPELHEYRLPMTDGQQDLLHEWQAHRGGGLFADDHLGVTDRTRYAQLARGFLYQGKGKGRTVQRIPSEKPRVVADLVRAEHAAGRQVLVWTVFDEETEILQGELGDLAVGSLHGSMSETARLAVLDRFRTGDLPVLISKASLIGYGLNLQHCRALIFSGFDDSFERMYQSVRRAYRFGQTETVHVHVPYVPDLEGMMWTNLQQKEARFLADVAACEAEYRKVLAGQGVLA